MSEFHVLIVRVGEIAKHPNADALSITKVFDYPVIFRTGEFQPGDLAAYVPVDAVVSPDNPRWNFLGGHTRIRAKRLRGVFSMGLLTTPPAGYREGEEAADILGVAKYEPPAELGTGGEDEPDPGFMPVYTDIEGLRRWPDVLSPGEAVVITEKIHGANARYCCSQGRLWAGSRTRIKRDTPRSIWWQAARHHGLDSILATAPDLAFYGEVFGQVGDLRYGSAKNDLPRLAFFDVLDIKTRRYLDHEDVSQTIRRLGLPMVPVLAVSLWEDAFRSHAEGSSTLADHVREGIVIKPLHERYDDRIGRVILKMHGEGFLTRKGG